MPTQDFTAFGTLDVTGKSNFTGVIDVGSAHGNVKVPFTIPNSDLLTYFINDDGIVGVTVGGTGALCKVQDNAGDGIQVEVDTGGVVVDDLSWAGAPSASVSVNPKVTLTWDDSVTTPTFLNMPCQDDTATAVINDTSASNNDGTLGAGNSADYSIAGPGGSLTKAISTAGNTAAVLTSAITIAADDAATVQWFSSGLATPFIGGPANAFDQIQSDPGNDLVNLVTGESEQLTRSIDVAAGYHHYALIFNGNGTCTLYVDAASVGAFSGTRMQPFAIGSVCQIGATAGIRVYDTVRTQEQIADDAALGGITSGTAPNITSSASVSVIEPATSVTTITATGDAPLTYSLVSGSDSAKFSINSNTGVLSFASPTDYEVRTDASLDGIYTVAVRVENAAGFDEQTFNVTVTNNTADDNEFGQSINSLLPASPTGSFLPIFSTFNTANNSSVYNTNCWAYPLNFSGVTWGPGISNGVAITKRHLICTNHAGVSVGDSVPFIKRDGTLVVRTVIDGVLNMGGSDPLGYRVLYLDSDLPSGIPLYRLMNLPIAEGTPIIKLDAENKALVVEAGVTNSVDIFFRGPIDATRVQYYEASISGDSGSPVFIVLDDELIYATSIVHAAAGDGPFVGNFINSILEACSDLDDENDQTGYMPSLVFAMSNQQLNIGIGIGL